MHILLQRFHPADRTIPFLLFGLVQFANPDFTQPISEVVDEVIQNCPIDTRRPLYKVEKPRPPPLTLPPAPPPPSPPLCLAEHRALRGLHHVQGLWPADAEGPQEDRGRAAENERRAERRQAEGEISRHQMWVPPHPPSLPPSLLNASVFVE